MSNIQLLWEKIQSAQNILLINHIRMDPDAYGSLTGFYQILESLGKNVSAINDQEAPENFWFMWMNHVFKNNISFPLAKGEDAWKADGDNKTPDLIISFDASSTDQLWEIYKENKEIFDTIDFFVIDHHITNPWFGQYNIIKTHYSSTCEITFEIIEELWYEEYMTPKIATCIFSWIVTDTNIFYNKNTTPNTHKVASRLMSHWADFRAPMYEFYKKQTLESLKFDSVLASKIQEEVINWLKVYYIIVELSDFDNSNIAYEFGSVYTKNFIWSTLANIEWWDIALILYPLKDWNYKASFRSKEFDVSSLCQTFGWWWHKLAAWCSYDGNVEDFKNEIFKKLSV